MNTEVENKTIYIGSLYALGATAIWAGNYIIARGLNELVPPVTLAFFRWLVAVVVFTPFAIKAVKTQWNLIKQNLGYLALIGILGVSAFNTLLYIASHTTSAINLSLMSLTFPIFIVIFSALLFREKVSFIQVLGICLVVTGVIVLVTRGKVNTLFSITFAIGDMWMLLGALVWAFYSLLLRRKPPDIKSVTFQYSTFALGLLCLLPFYIWESSISPPIVAQTRIIFALLYIGIVSSLVAYYLWNKSVDLIGPSKAAMIFYTSPLFIGILAYIFLHETIGMVHLYSALLIIPGILVSNYQPKKR